MSEKKELKAIKVTSEFKDHLNNIIAQSGLPTDEAWLEEATKLWELKMLKEGNPGYKKELDELEYHTQRTLEIFISMIGSEAADRHKLVQEHEEQMMQKQDEITRIAAENGEIKKQLQTATELLGQANKDKGELEKQIRQLEEIVRKNDLLISEYKEKNDTLAGLVKEYKPAGDKLRSLESELAKTQSENERMKDNVRRLEMQATQLEERHKEELARLAEKKDLEKEREILQLRAEHQNKLQEITETSNAKIRELLAALEQSNRSKTQDQGGLSEDGAQ